MSFVTDPFNDTFSREEASGLGVSDSGHSWTAPSFWSVDGSRAIVSASYGDETIALVDGSDDDVVDVYANLFVPTPPVGDDIRFQFISRYAAGDYTMGQIILNPNQSMELAIQDTGDTVLYPPTEAPSWAGQQYISARYQQLSGVARLKVWFTDDEEPENWNLYRAVSSTNSTGQTGMRLEVGTGVSNEPYTLYVDDVVMVGITPAVNVFDSFTRTTFSGWEYSDSTHLWTKFLGNDVTLSTNGTQGLFTLSASTSFDNVGLYIGPTITDFTMVTEFSIDVAPASSTAIGFIRHTDTNNYIWAFISHAPALTRTMTIRKVIGGVQTTVATTALANYAAGTTYKMRVYIAGSSLKFRVWAAADPEPTTWDLDATDSVLPPAGYMGLRASKSASAVAYGSVISFDNLSAQSLEIAITAALYGSADSPGVLITITNGNIYDTVRVERISTLGQYEIESVRGLDHVTLPSDLASEIDYECPLVDSFIYRVYGLDPDGVVLNRTETEPIAIEAPYHRAILKSVLLPTYSRQVQVIDFKEFSREMRIIQEAQVLGKTKPVILFDVLNGMTGKMRVMALRGSDTAGLDIRDVIENGQPLLFQNVRARTGITDFYCVVTGMQAIRVGTVKETGSPIYVYDLDFKEISRPPTDEEDLGFYTWQTLVDVGHADFTSVRDTFATWLDVLNFTGRTPV